jgi:hypothetical protein
MITQQHLILSLVITLFILHSTHSFQYECESVLHGKYQFGKCYWFNSDISTAPSEHLSYDDAQQYCHTIGFDGLVQIQFQQELNFVWNTLKEKQLNSDAIWLGHILFNDTWVYESDDSPITFFNNLNIDNTIMDENEELVMELSINDGIYNIVTKEMGQVGTDRTNRYVCEKEYNSHCHRVLQGHYMFGKCYTTSTSAQMSREDAESTCKSLGYSSLVQIDSAAERNWIVSKLLNNSIVSVWIDNFITSSTGKWSFSDCRNVTFNEFADGYPKLEHNLAVLRTDLNKYVSSDFSSSFGYICEYQEQDWKCLQSHGYTYNDKCFVPVLPIEKNYNDADSDCVNRFDFDGLSEIRNTMEHSFVVDLMRSINTNALLGMTQNIDDSDFSFRDGTNVTYLPWYISPPEDSSFGFVSMNMDPTSNFGKYAFYNNINTTGYYTCERFISGNSEPGPFPSCKPLPPVLESEVPQLSINLESSEPVFPAASSSVYSDSSIGLSSDEIDFSFDDSAIIINPSSFEESLPTPTYSPPGIGCSVENMYIAISIISEYSLVNTIASQIDQCTDYMTEQDRSNLIESLSQKMSTLSPELSYDASKWAVNSLKIMTADVANIPVSVSNRACGIISSIVQSNILHYNVLSDIITIASNLAVTMMDTTSTSDQVTTFINMIREISSSIQELLDFDTQRQYELNNIAFGVGSYFNTTVERLEFQLHNPQTFDLIRRSIRQSNSTIHISIARFFDQIPIFIHTMVMKNSGTQYNIINSTVISPIVSVDLYNLNENHIAIHQDSLISSTVPLLADTIELMNSTLYQLNCRFISSGRWTNNTSICRISGYTAMNATCTCSEPVIHVVTLDYYLVVDEEPEPTDPLPTTNPRNSKSKLSDSAIVGIVLGIVLPVAFILIILLFILVAVIIACSLVKAKKNKKNQSIFNEQALVELNDL